MLSTLPGIPLLRTSSGPFSCREAFGHGVMEMCVALCRPAPEGEFRQQGARTDPSHSHDGTGGASPTAERDSPGGFGEFLGAEGNCHRLEPLRPDDVLQTILVLRLVAVGLSAKVRIQLV